MSARLGAAITDLVVWRCRNPPYLTAAGVRYPEILKWLAEQCPNRVDAYIEWFVTFYGKYGVCGLGARSELTLVHFFGGTDMSSGERLHSVQAKKTRETTTN